MSERPAILGSYAVERELGRGGMGIVYLARDSRLDRPVAIKVLPDAFTHDPERLARFEREAKLLASLNHPNIGAIYGIEQDGARRFLVLEYVPGDTLAARTGHGPLPPDEALEVCRQIAAALEAAHDSGVIHRDVKPGNVKVMPGGEVKVLDFGLAKGPETSASTSDLSHSPTAAFSPTGVGVILGTAAYMSPEQARGRSVDRRTDIWSFGCVLYECLTGRQLFLGETVSDTIAQILERQPDYSKLPAQTPPRVRDLLERCLEKDSRKRLRDIGDARLDLEAAIAARASDSQLAAAGAASRRASGARPSPILAAALVLAGAVAGIAAWGFLRPGGGVGPGPRGPARVSVLPPGELRVSVGDLSPDGRTLVMAARPRGPGSAGSPQRLYARPLGSLDAKPLPGTENVSSYFFSPDSRWVVFSTRVASENSQRRLAKVALDGNSPAVTLCDWDDAWNRGFVWLPDGDILLLRGQGAELVRVPASGGAPSAPTPISPPGMTVLSIGNALPGGRAVFLWRESWGERGYENDLWLLDPRTGKARELIRDGNFGAYVPGGYVLFSRKDALFAVPFDLGRLRVTGEAVPLFSGMRTAQVWANAYFAAGGGNLFYRPGGILGDRRQLVTIGASGDTSAFTTERRPYEQMPVASPDGRRVAVILPNSKGTFEIWIADRDRPGLVPGVAQTDADCTQPVWSPDGRRIAFERYDDNPRRGVYLARLGSGEPPELIATTGELSSVFSPTSWSPDGSQLVVQRRAQGRADMFVVDMTSPKHEMRPLRVTPADEGEARHSPDGKLLAYLSDETGKAQMYVAAVGADGSLGPPLMVSAGAGVVTAAARWIRDGDRLLYGVDGERVVSVTIHRGPALGASAPVVLHRFEDLHALGTEWNVLPDGRLIVIRRPDEESEVSRFDFVIGFDPELRDRMNASGRGGR